MAGYANPEVLVSTEWVAEHGHDPKVRIVESNEDRALYTQGHVAGAVEIGAVEAPWVAGGATSRRLLLESSGGETE